jgi:hypothetical protein
LLGRGIGWLASAEFSPAYPPCTTKPSKNETENRKAKNAPANNPKPKPQDTPAAVQSSNKSDAIITNTPKPQSGIERANPTHHTRKFLIPKVDVCVHDNQPLQPREFSFQRYFLHRSIRSEEGGRSMGVPGRPSQAHAVPPASGASSARWISSSTTAQIRTTREPRTPLGEVPTTSERIGSSGARDWLAGGLR